MTTYYLRAGGGNWSAAATWSLTSGGGATGSVPTAADDVICDAGSSTANLTVDGTSGTPSKCRSIVCTGFTGTLTMGATAYLEIGDGTAGATTFVSGMTFAPNSAATIKWKSTTTGNNITWGGKNLPVCIFDGVGGAWTFQSAPGTGNNVTITLTNGTLDTNGFNVTAGLSSDNSNTRALTLGTTTWSIPNSGSIGWNIGTSTGMTLSAGSSTISDLHTNSNGTFAGGGLTYGTYTCSVSSGVMTMTGANTFGTLTLSGGVTTGSHQLGANQTVTGTFNSNGSSLTARCYVRSTVKGTARTITAATVSCTYADFQDITGAGAGSWNLSAITGNSGDCGGNSGITFTTPANQYWVPSAGTSTGSMSAVTRWASSSGGTAGTGRAPLPQDTAIFDANSIDAGSRTITQDKNRMSGMDWSACTNNPTLAMGTAVMSYYGGIILKSGMTVTGASGNVTLEGRGSYSFKTDGVSWTKPLVVDCVDGAGTYTLGSNISSSSSLTGTSGSWSSASTYTQSYTILTWNGGTFTETGDITLSGALSVTGGTFANNSGMISSSSTASFTGGTSNIKGFSGTQLTHGAGTVTCGASGFTCSTFTKNGAGAMTINGASTFSGNMTFSSTGTLAINANVTGSGALAQNGQTVTITDATLAYNNGAYVGTGAGGGGGGAGPNSHAYAF